MSKSTKKRTVTCGKCKKTGHNARTCPSSKTKAKEEIKALPTPEKRRMNTVPKREGQTGNMGVGSYAPPYRCNKCNQVAILVAVKIKDHNQSFLQKKEIFMSDLRCEKCMNKPSPSDLILKWGASPDEVVPIPGQDDA